MNWGQDWRTATPEHRDILDFESWKPVFLTPRLINRRASHRSWFVFGGCGMMILLAFLYVMAVFLVATVVLEWDAMVFFSYGIVWVSVTTFRKVRRRRTVT